MLEKMIEKLNVKQEQFCRAYVSREFFGNGLQAYMSVYKCKASTARTQASITLTNPNICARIEELLESEGLNNNHVDKQLLFCMNQYVDLSIKMQAIREYNKLRNRITERKNIHVAKVTLASLFEGDNDKEE